MTLPNCYRCHSHPCRCKDGITLYCADCRDVMPHLDDVSVCIADPPYGETSLKWDQWVNAWPIAVPSRSLWCFGSIRMFLNHAADFDGWKLAQDVVWEKQNGSNFHADRFRRVHENVLHFYRGRWIALYKKPATTPDATKRTVRRKERPPHTGEIPNSTYTSIDGGPRLQRSVIRCRNCHGVAQHPTQKPVELVRVLIEYSCPPDGIVLDPFAGSGTTLRAAKDLGRKAIGIEIKPEYCSIAAARLEQGVLFQ